MTEQLAQDLIARHGVFADVNGYQVVPIYRKPDDAARNAVIKLWHDNKLLSDQKLAEERAKQIVFVIIGPDNELAGVNTVYVSDFSKMPQVGGPAGNFYFYRTFIRPQDRVHNMAARVLGMTYDYLNAFPGTTPRPQGLVLVTENPKLKEPGAQRTLQRMGWDTLGRTATDQIVMKRDFAKIN